MRTPALFLGPLLAIGCDAALLLPLDAALTPTDAVTVAPGEGGVADMRVVDAAPPERDGRIRPPPPPPPPPPGDAAPPPDDAAPPPDDAGAPPGPDAGGCGAPCAACILEARPDVLPFYADNGWDTGCAQRDAIVANWCDIDPSGCAAAREGPCAGPCAEGPDPPPPPPGDAVFKVTRNHQWTCDENRFDIQLHVSVRDAQGAPIPGAVIRIGHSGNARHPDGRFEAYPVPDRLVTDADGFARLPQGNRWPIGVRDDGETDFFILDLQVDGAPSDRAVELTTGFWETNENVVGPGAACRYCGGNDNVWGHWSYTVEFTRTPGADQVCDVPTDHAGMARCDPVEHVGHPDERACRPVQRQK